MKKDIQIQKHVSEELISVPAVNASEIGVAVKNGIVTLTGCVDSYPKKIMLERAVLKLKDVQGLADELKVNIKSCDIKEDSALAQAVLYSLTWHSAVHVDSIKILVEDGVVTLDGQVDWDFQRKSAFETIKNITGVKRIINNIKIATQPMPAQIEDKIHSAFLRNANIDPAKIRVEVLGNKVVLVGKVKCWAEKQEAEHTV